MIAAVKDYLSIPIGSYTRIRPLWGEHEETPLCRRTLAAFLYHAGLSCRMVEPFVNRSYEAIRQWYRRLKRLFEPDCRDRQEVAVDEMKIEIDGEEALIWPAVDCDTLEVLAVNVSPRSVESGCTVVSEKRALPVPRLSTGAGQPRPLVKLAACPLQVRI